MDKERETLVARLRQWAGNRDMKRIFPVVSADLERIADTLTAPQPKYEVKHRTANAEERKVYDAIAANYHAPQQEPVAGRCVAPPCKCSDENRRKCAYWHEAPQPDGVGVPREECECPVEGHMQGCPNDKLGALLAAAKEQQK